MRTAEGLYKRFSRITVSLISACRPGFKWTLISIEASPPTSPARLILPTPCQLCPSHIPPLVSRSSEAGGRVHKIRTNINDALRLFELWTDYHATHRKSLPCRCPLQAAAIGSQSKTGHRDGVTDKRTDGGR